MGSNDQQSSAEATDGSATQEPTTILLPKNCKDWKWLESAGVRRWECQDASKQFVKVDLPPGWRKTIPVKDFIGVSCCDLLDENANVRARIWYARDSGIADMYVQGRFQIVRKNDVYSHDQCDDPDCYLVVDCDNKDKILYWTNAIPSGRRFDDLLYEQAIAWLKTNYPEYENPNAYRSSDQHINTENPSLTAEDKTQKSTSPVP